MHMNFNTNHRGDGFYMNSDMGFGNGYSGMSGGYRNMGTFSGLLALLINIFVIVFVVALVLALIVVIKNIIFTPKDIQTIKNTFAGTPKERCSICSNELNHHWKVCPYCGKSIDNGNR